MIEYFVGAPFSLNCPCLITKVRSMDFGRVYFNRGLQTVYRHLHHPAKNDLRVSLSAYCFFK